MDGKRFLMDGKRFAVKPKKGHWFLEKDGQQLFARNHARDLKDEQEISSKYEIVVVSKK